MLVIVCDMYVCMMMRCIIVIVWFGILQMMCVCLMSMMIGRGLWLWWMMRDDYLLQLTIDADWLRCVIHMMIFDCVCGLWVCRIVMIADYAWWWCVCDADRLWLMLVMICVCGAGRCGVNRVMIICVVDADWWAWRLPIIDDGEGWRCWCLLLFDGCGGSWFADV